jgi:hypothetical protein
MSPNGQEARMPIAKEIKEAVRARLLAELATYWEEAEEHEDDSTLQDFDAGARYRDLTLYLHTSRAEENMILSTETRRKATLAEVERALLAYRDGVLEQGVGKYRLFDGAHDAPNVKLALALSGVDCNTTAILNVALKLKLC